MTPGTVPESRAFPGWRAKWIHIAFDEPSVSEDTVGFPAGGAHARVEDAPSPMEGHGPANATAPLPGDLRQTVASHGCSARGRPGGR